MAENTIKTTIKTIIITALIVISIIAVISFLVPLKKTYLECYKEIAEEECDDKVLMFFGIAKVDTVFSMAYNFKCCDYSKVNNLSRNVFDKEPDCDFCNFIESDHKKCSKTYRYWKRVE